MNHTASASPRGYLARLPVIPGLGPVETAGFLFLLAAQLALVWAFPIIPTQDGPSHLENAAIIRGLLFEQSAIYESYYALNNWLTPNWAGHMILAVLLGVFDAPVAEKIVIGIYVVLFPISFLYAVTFVRRDAGFLVFLAFPFVFNYPLHKGFHGFCYSLPVFALTLGFWLRRSETMQGRSAVGLAALAIWLALCHVMTFALAAGVILALACCFALSRAMAGENGADLRAPAAWRAARRQVAPIVLAFAPALALLAWFVFNRSAGAEEFAFPLRRLLSLHSLVSFQETEFIPSITLAVLFAGMTLARLIEFRKGARCSKWDWLLVAAALYVVLYFFTPDAMFGGTYVKRRLSLFPYLMLLPWLASFAHSTLVRRAVPVFGGAITVALLGLHAQKYAELKPFIGEYLSAANVIEPDSTILPICYEPAGAGPDDQVIARHIDVFLHTAGYLAAERRAVNWANYEAQMDFFPVRFKERVAAVNVVDMSSGRPRYRLESLLAGPEVRTDYVLTWGEAANSDDRAAATELDRHLKAGFDLAFVSRPTGKLRVYKRRGRD